MIFAKGIRGEIDSHITAIGLHAKEFTIFTTAP